MKSKRISIQNLVKYHEPLIQELGGDIDLLKSIKPPFPRMTYSDAIIELQNKGSRIQWGEDIGTKDEMLLTKDRDLPIFITYYPAKAKPFYHKPKDDNTKLVCCADLLLPKGSGELIGGGQRIHDKQQLK